MQSQQPPAPGSGPGGHPRRFLDWHQPSARFRWSDRRAAGRELAERFSDCRGRTQDTLLLALPRGGVPVAAAMARPLQLPLATWAARKLADPSAPEFAIGAVAPGDVVLWELPAGACWPGVEQRQQLVRQQQQELQRRQQLFGDPPPESLRGRHLILVDDGIATGLTARAALQSLRQLDPASLSLAVPVLDQRVVPQLQPLVDRLEALLVVDGLRSVGAWYERFEQLEDSAVLALLDRAGGSRS